MKKILKWSLMLAIAVIGKNTGWAQNAPAGEACTFTEGVRYSQLVINSRINDFKANTTASGFGVFDSEGKRVAAPNNSKSNLDYVPGLVAKAILEAVDYYKDNQAVDVKPWFYAIQNYGNTLDIAQNGKGGVHLVRCCKSAGLGGSNYRDGSANYYLMGKDTEPTTTSGSNFYTEGKVLGGFIMAATEYERLMDNTVGISPVHTASLNADAVYSLNGHLLPRAPQHGVYISGGKKKVAGGNFTVSSSSPGF